MARRQIDPDLQAGYEANRAHREIEERCNSDMTDFNDRKEVERIQMERDCAEGAHSIRTMYNAYIEEGFTEEQSWELVKIAVAGASQPRRLF